jgi:hypothetical protein
MSNVLTFPGAYEPPAPDYEPLPTRAELRDLVAHGCMTAHDAAECPVSDPPQLTHHPMWGVLTLVFIGVAIGIVVA